MDTVSARSPAPAAEHHAGVALSVVVPVLNEQDSVVPLHEELSAALRPLDSEYEIIFVDDGSSDATLSRLVEIHERSPDVRVVSLRRRFGKTAALVAGFQEARGSVVLTMDGDLQDDAREIPRFLAELDTGFDLVVGWKRERHDPITKTLPSSIFNAMVRLVSGIELHDFNCGFKAYRREVLDELRLYGDMHRFIPVLAGWRGFRVGELVVNHRPREHGRSKFGAARVLSGMFDFARVLFLTRFMQRPLQLFGTVGAGLLSLGAAGGIYLAILKFVEGQSIGVRHLPLLLFTVMVILFGTMLVAIGLIGEMQRHLSYRARDEYSVRLRLP